jgi:hypothetical protein
MKKLNKALNKLLHGDYFDTVLEHIYAVALVVLLFLAIGYFFIFYPIVLLYLLIAGMLLMGWFMMIALFPDFYHQVRSIMTSALQFFGKNSRR